MILIDFDAFLLRAYDRNDLEDSVLKYIKARYVRRHIINFIFFLLNF